MNDFSYYLDALGEFGIVDQVTHPIVSVQGLPGAKTEEIVLFETGQLGQVFTIGKDGIEILVFSREAVKVGTRVTRTDKNLSVPVGRELLGFVVDPLGRPISSPTDFKTPKEEREIDVKPLGIDKRKIIKKPLKTGVTLVDLMVPIGKGQKELIIGDRKTGKTSFLLTTIKTQVSEGSVVVYAAIAKKKSDIKKLEEFFTAEKILDKIVIVASVSHDSPSLIYLTPYTAMTIAEYFRDQGEDVLVVFDDLSTHAKFYREISLLAKGFPGRDSYPGDIFYTHAKLLERAGNFKNEKEGVAITCLPIAETIEGDLTGYIATNLMGMTDGHIFFDSNLYYKGRRPAINTSLSVTRVGRQTQKSVNRNVNHELTVFFTLYERLQNLSHFGAELTDTVKQILSTGDRLYNFFDQPYTLIVPEEVQLILFCLLWLNLLEGSENRLNEIREKLIVAYQEKNTRDLFNKILKVDSFNQLLENITKNRDSLLSLLGAR